MSRVVERLAELTGLRDRDMLDVTLVGVMRDMLRPLRSSIYRAVGERGHQRWTMRATLAAEDKVASADALWLEFDSLPTLDSDPERHTCFSEQRVVGRPGPPAVTMFPLYTDRDASGVLEVVSAQPLSVEQRGLVGSILHIYRNFQGLLDYSERDTLTGLLNRKTYDECFVRLAASTAASRPAVADAGTVGGERSDAPPARACLGVIDIDHFKRINDTYGHLIGDEVLLLLSRLLSSSFRYHDLAFRFGGEEFVVLMRCNSLQDGVAAFERFRHNVEQHVFPRVGHITVSVGVAELRAADSPTGCFERADRAVYYAKEHGRNQVASFDALVRSGTLADADHATDDVELF